jgi:hypothetical protein
MIVLDASGAVDWLLQTSAAQGIEKRIYSRNETLHAPHLLDLESHHSPTGRRCGYRRHPLASDTRDFGTSVI